MSIEAPMSTLELKLLSAIRQEIEFNKNAGYGLSADNSYSCAHRIVYHVLRNQFHLTEEAV